MENWRSSREGSSGGENLIDIVIPRRYTVEVLPFFLVTQDEGMNKWR
jgi:hypothetical protein